MGWGERHESIEQRLRAIETDRHSLLRAAEERERKRRVNVDARLAKLEQHVVDHDTHLHDRPHRAVGLVVDGGDPFVVGARSPKHRREGVRRAVRHALKAGQQIFRYLVHVRNVGARLAGRSGK